jgi:adenosylhomocysteine nucleosidase
MTRTAIIAALPGELKPFVRGWSHQRSNGVDLWRYPHDDGEWIAACAGAGQAAATRAFAGIEKSGPLDRVISTGWAGALRDDLQSGQAYLVSTVLDTKTGERFAASMPNTSSTLTTTAPGAQEVSGHDFSQAKTIPTKQPRALAPEPLTLVTTPTVAAEPEKHRLALAYSAALVDMEAAAIARLAQMRQIPFDCIKGISDGFNDQLPDFNRFILSDGSFQLSRFVLFSFLRPWYWPALIQMGENSRKAAQSIAESLLHLLNPRGQIRERNGYPNHKH